MHSPLAPTLVLAAALATACTSHSSPTTAAPRSTPTTTSMAPTSTTPHPTTPSPTGAGWSTADIKIYKKTITSPPHGMSSAAADCLIRRLQAAGVSFDQILTFDPKKDPALAEKIKNWTTTCIAAPGIG